MSKIKNAHSVSGSNIKWSCSNKTSYYQIQVDNDNIELVVLAKAAEALLGQIINSFSLKLLSKMPDKIVDKLKPCNIKKTHSSKLRWLGVQNQMVEDSDS